MDAESRSYMTNHLVWISRRANELSARVRSQRVCYLDMRDELAELVRLLKDLVVLATVTREKGD